MAAELAAPALVRGALPELRFSEAVAAYMASCTGVRLQRSERGCDYWSRLACVFEGAATGFFKSKPPG